MYAPQTDAKPEWPGLFADKLNGDIAKLINDSYRERQDKFLHPITAKRVILLVPERGGNPHATQSAATAATVRLRAGRGDRAWLASDVTVTIQGRDEFFTPDEINQIDGVADDPPTDPLDRRMAELASIERFQYRFEWVPFLGRQAELEKIARGCADAARFGWRVIHGDGGMGKSRLGLQACRVAAAGGVACRVSTGAPADNPRRPAVAAAA